jgi:glycosyltransferase involved in cell wall biosynthesis
MTPFVSIIVPAHNAGVHIADTLASAVHQTYRHFEIIVVDDGSTDDTAAIAESYGDRGVLLVSQANAGPTAARNRALSVARGDCVALLDSDDLWEPAYLETMVEFLGAHPETPIAFPDVRFFGESKFAGRRFHEVYPPNPPITFAKLVSGASHICLDATIRREVFARVGLFDENIWSAGDFDFWLRALHEGCRIEPVPKVLGHYRRQTTSMSLDAITSCSSALQALDKWRNREGLAQEECQAVEASYTEWQYRLDVALARDSIGKEEFSAAAEFLRRAHAHTPKLRYRAARVGLAVAPRLVRRALGMRRR